MDPLELADQLERDLGIRACIVPSDAGFILSTLIVPRVRQRQGLGTRAMERLCAAADAEGWRLLLSPATKDPHHGTTSRARLVRFYTRFGFHENRGRKRDFTISCSMIREPRPTRA